MSAVKKEQEKHESQKEEDVELQEWMDSLDSVIEHESKDRAKVILNAVLKRGQDLELLSQKKEFEPKKREKEKVQEEKESSENQKTKFGKELSKLSTEYLNTISKKDQYKFPGDLKVEKQIENYCRWNATIMVDRANQELGLGGHISTYLSCSTLFEVGFNHFFRGRDHESGGDYVYFQGHASPGVYARSFLEGRLTEKHLDNFRQDTKENGLSSYPHPWLMPDYWEFPTVSMGLGPIQGVYRARFLKYLQNRKLLKKSDQAVWVFVGDGEFDEPETKSGLNKAATEKLNNLIFVFNCNLQRLDGPVRGNSKIIQEIESHLRGVGWKVIKVLWGSNWDPLLEADDRGKLLDKLSSSVDGDFQKVFSQGLEAVFNKFIKGTGKPEEVFKKKNYQTLSDLRPGGLDIEKIYSAYKAAMDFEEGPVAILAQTIKGFELGDAGEAKNMTHKKTTLSGEEAKYFADRMGLKISGAEAKEKSYLKFPNKSSEALFLSNCRSKRGGMVPCPPNLKLAEPWKFNGVLEKFKKGNKRNSSTTMEMVRQLRNLLKNEEFGKNIIPVVVDESRTFGLDGLFRAIKIYSPQDQLYEPVDQGKVIEYRESIDGQIIEEGITESGAMATFIAAGTNHRFSSLTCIPFYFFYSMFGLQRTGDLIWAAADARTRGFLIGATSGRTTLNGEGLQHQDGHSQLWSLAVPNLRSYDVATSYELATILEKGLESMFSKGNDEIFYLTLQNENVPQDEMPKGCEEGIMKGLYKYKEFKAENQKIKVVLLGSGALLYETVLAAEELKDKGVSVDVWSVTSYKALWDEARNSSNTSYLTEQLQGTSEIFIAVSDFVSSLPQVVSSYIPGKFYALGTDDFGRSGTRKSLRKYFGIDSQSIVEFVESKI